MISLCMLISPTPGLINSNTVRSSLQMFVTDADEQTAKLQHKCHCDELLLKACGELTSLSLWFVA